MFGRYLLSRVARVSVVLALAATACSSAGDEVSASDTSSTTTIIESSTTAAPLRSGDAVAVPTTDANGNQTAYRPSTTTTTTTTPPPLLPENDPVSLEVDPIFAPILDQLARSTGVPIRLPARLGDPDTGAQDGEGFGVATLDSAGADGYAIYIGAPDCNGGNVCRGGSFTARRIGPSDDLEGDPSGIEIPLPGGGRGRFVDAYCGANCGDGIVEWAEDDVLYSVGLKVGSGADVIPLAFSAVEPDAEPPTTPDDCGSNPANDGERSANRFEIDGIDWLIVCTPDGNGVEVVDELGALRWKDLGNGTRDIVLERPDGTSRVFFVAGTTITPLLDDETFDRAVIFDLRCSDVDSDGVIDLVDARTGRNHSTPNSAGVPDATSLPQCP